MTSNNKSTDVYELAKKLPQTQKLVESLTSIDQTVQEMIDYVAKLEKENMDLKSQLLDMQKHFLMTTSHVYPIEINNQ